MKANPVAANVLGTMGTICWSGQLIPQVWKNYRDKKTTGLSPWLMFIWGAASAFLGVYAIIQKLNIPLQIQPQTFGFLALLSWGQCLYYDPDRQSKKKLSVMFTIGTMVAVGAFEVLLVFVSRPAAERGIDAPVKLFGILSVLAVAAGLFPQYWEIYVRKEVMGVSYTFICVDMLGGVLSVLSLAFADHFDGLAAASYTAVVVMDSVIIFAAIILNPLARKRRRREAEAAAAAEARDVESRGESGANNTVPSIRPPSTSGDTSPNEAPTVVGHAEESKDDTGMRLSEKAEKESPRIEISGDGASMVVSSTTVSGDGHTELVSEITRTPDHGSDPPRVPVVPAVAPPEGAVVKQGNKLEKGNTANIAGD